MESLHTYRNLQDQHKEFTFTFHPNSPTVSFYYNGFIVLSLCLSPCLSLDIYIIIHTLCIYHTYHCFLSLSKVSCRYNSPFAQNSCVYFLRIRLFSCPCYQNWDININNIFWSICFLIQILPIVQRISFINFICGPEFDPGSQVAFTCHALLVIFNLELFLSLSLSFMCLAFLKSVGQLF